MKVSSFPPVEEEEVPQTDARYTPVHFDGEDDSSQNPESPVDIFHKHSRKGRGLGAHFLCIKGQGRLNRPAPA